MRESIVYYIYASVGRAYESFGLLEIDNFLFFDWGSPSSLYARRLEASRETFIQVFTYSLRKLWLAIYRSVIIVYVQVIFSKVFNI